MKGKISIDFKAEKYDNGVSGKKTHFYDYNKSTGAPELTTANIKIKNMDTGTVVVDENTDKLYKEYKLPGTNSGVSGVEYKVSITSPLYEKFEDTFTLNPLENIFVPDATTKTDMVDGESIKLNTKKRNIKRQVINECTAYLFEGEVTKSEAEQILSSGPSAVDNKLYATDDVDIPSDETPQLTMVDFDGVTNGNGETNSVPGQKFPTKLEGKKYTFVTVRFWIDWVSVKTTKTPLKSQLKPHPDYKSFEMAEEQ